jgi:hypothetical protein
MPRSVMNILMGKLIMRHKTHERFVQAVIARSALYDEAGVVHGRTVHGPNDGIQKTVCMLHHSGLLRCARNDNL